MTFAVSSLLLGETTRAGALETWAWKKYGYDLDGLTTTKDSTNVCTLHMGAPATNQVDGDGGVDNAFGALILPIIQVGTSIQIPSDNATKLIASGAWTLQIEVRGLSGDANQTATGLEVQMFTSGPFGATPSFDSTTDWPVLPSSLTDGQTLASGARVTFATSYVTNGVVVALSASQPLVIPVELATKTGSALPVATLELRIRDAIVTFDATTGDNGTIAGIIDSDDAIAAAAAFGPAFDKSLCGPAFLGIADQIRQAQDILSDGTNHAGATCDAISIGIGFTAKRVANPTQVGVDPTPPPEPCPVDGGAD